MWAGIQFVFTKPSSIKWSSIGPDQRGPFPDSYTSGLPADKILDDVFCCSFIWKPAVSAIVIVSLHIMYLLFAYVFLYLCTYPLMPFCIMSRQIPCRLEWIKIVHSWKRSLRRKKPPYMCLMLCKVLCSIGLNLSYFIWVLWER